MGWTIVYLILESIIVLLVYKYIFHAKLVKQVWKYVVGIILVALVQGGLYLWNPNITGSLLIWCLGWIIPLCYSEKYKGRMVLYYPIVCNGFSIASVLFAYVWAFVLRIDYITVVKSIPYTSLVDASIIIVLVIIGICGKKRNYEVVKLGVSQYLMLCIGTFCSIIMIGYAQNLEKGEESQVEYISAVGMALVIVACLFIVLGTWHQIVWKRSKEYQMQNELYENFLEMQEQHIRSIIREDEKMRRFRHDYRAHTIAMHALMQNNQVDELKQYIANMESDLKQWQVTKYTGLSAVDAIVEEVHQRCRDKHVHWEWEGTLLGEEKIDLYALCVIFSNLLNNALEACERKEGPTEIKVLVKRHCNLCYIKISNTCEEDLTIEKINVTSKEDDKNHGLGIRNVREIVEKQRGKIEYQIESGWCHVEVRF